MKRRYSISRAAATIAAVPVVLFLATSCAQKKGDAWVSPADDASLARLETATLERNVPNSRRARLFFLWGQELADKGEDEKAIGAFERVVDLRSDLVDESRFNLEILWRRQSERKQQDQQGQQGQQDKQNSQDKQRQQGASDKSNGDQKSGDQKKTDGKQGQQDKQNAAGKSAAKDRQAAQQKDTAAKQNQSAPKDLSALVRDKAQSSDLDKALKAELERRNEKQKAESGGIAPVEKDW